MRSMTIVRMIMVAAVLSGPAMAANLKSADLFPFKVGDYWIFQAQYPWGHSVDVRLDVTKSSNGWFYVTGHPLGDAWYKNSGIWLNQYHQGSSRSLIKANAKVGETWKMNAAAMCLDNAKVELVADWAYINNPAGDFSNCLIYSVAGGCADAGVQSLTVAPGVGVIAWSEGNIAGTVEYTLKEAKVKGVQYPIPYAGLQVAGSADKAIYVHRVNPPVTPSAPHTLIPAEMSAKLLVKNLSTQSIDLIHNSGQRFDFSIAPANDPSNPVRFWSNDRFFTMAFTKTTVDAGKEAGFGDVMQLVDNNGQILPPGLYVLRGWVANNPLAFELIFEIQNP